MFILGHLGLTAFFASILSLSPLTAAIASLIPDLIDKPLFLLGLAPLGRYIGHTLLVVLSFGAISYAITKRKLFSISISFGMIMHLFEDPGFVPWFFPFIKYDFPAPKPLEYTLLMFLFDLTGLLILIILFKKNETFRREILNLLNWIKTMFNKH